MKFSIKYYVLYFMGFLVFSFFFIPLILNTYYILPVFAADSSPSADVKAKLEALKQEIASKAAQLKTEVNKKLQNKAFIGVVKSKSASSITIAAKTGSKLVSVNQDTIYQDSTPKKKAVKTLPPSVQTINEESNIAALGDIDDAGVLHARKVILLPATSNTLPKAYIWGQVASITDLVAIKTSEGRTEPVSVEDIDVKFDINDFVIVTGVKNKNDILEASYLYVIPQGKMPSPKISTPSATPKAPTPSVKKGS